jgi:hypothetical protein
MRCVWNSTVARSCTRVTRSGQIASFLLSLEHTRTDPTLTELVSRDDRIVTGTTRILHLRAAGRLLRPILFLAGPLQALGRRC